MSWCVVEHQERLHHPLDLLQSSTESAVLQWHCPLSIYYKYSRLNIIQEAPDTLDYMTQNLTGFFEVILVGIQHYELYCFVVMKSGHINRCLLPQHRQLYHLQSYHWKGYMSFESHPPADVWREGRVSETDLVLGKK